MLLLKFKGSDAWSPGALPRPDAQTMAGQNECATFLPVNTNGRSLLQTFPQYALGAGISA
jgi:hypothetical protein